MKRFDLSKLCKSVESSTLYPHLSALRSFLYQDIPTLYLQFLAIELFGSCFLVGLVGHNIELFGFLVQYPSKMDMVFEDMFLLDFCFLVSFLVFVHDDVLRLEAFFGIGVPFVQNLQCFGQRLSVVDDKRLSILIGRRKSLVCILSMLQLLSLTLLLVLLLSFFIIQSSINRVICMSLPIFLNKLTGFLLNLILQPSLMVLFVHIRDNIVLFLVVLQQFFLSFYWKLDFSIAKEVIWYFLIVYNVICVPYWAQFPDRHFFFIGFIGFQVDYIEIFLVFERLFLNKMGDTR